MKLNNLIIFTSICMTLLFFIPIQNSYVRWCDNIIHD